MMIEDESDRSEIAQIYEENKKKLYKVAYDILRNHHDAEDCVQDVIIALIDYLDKYRAATPVHRKNILFRMCRNIAIDKYRKTKRQLLNEQFAEPEEEWFVVDDDAFVEAWFARQENRLALERMIASLEPTYSDVLYYFYYMDMSTESIARMLCISESLVRMRLTRARRKLLAQWEGELNELREK
jgi:RNA polymerase sigma-70 factor (ECF subfamily)